MSKLYHWTGSIAFLLIFGDCEGNSISKSIKQLVLISMDNFIGLQIIKEKNETSITTHDLLARDNDQNSLAMRKIPNDRMNKFQAQGEGMAMATLDVHSKQEGLDFAAREKRSFLES